MTKTKVNNSQLPDEISGKTLSSATFVSATLVNATVNNSFVNNATTLSLANNTFLGAKNFADSSFLSIIKLNTADKLEFGNLPISFGSAVNYGTSGQVLTSQGSNSSPVWANAGSGSAGSSNSVVIACSNAQSISKIGADLVLTGTNDATAINTFLGSFSSGRMPRIYFTEGDVAVNTPILVAKNQYWNGAGQDQTRFNLANAVNDYAIKFVNGDTSEIKASFKDFSVNCNGLNQTAGGGIYAPGAVHSMFDNIHFQEMYNYGIFLYRVTPTYFGHHNKVTNCLFDNATTVGGNGMGVLMDSSDENWIIKCDFEQCGGSGADPFAIKDTAGLNIISSTVFVNGKGGIFVANGKNSKVVDCIFDGCKQTDIKIQGDYTSVDNCLFYSTAKPTAGTYSCIDIHYCKENKISNNTFGNADAVNGDLHSLIRIQGSGNHLVTDNFNQNIASVTTTNYNDSGTIPSIFRSNGNSGLPIIDNSISQSTVQVNFGTQEDGMIVTTVTDTTANTAKKYWCGLECSSTADHDPEDYLLEGVQAYVANVVNGVGYDLIASCTDTTFGRYNIKIINS
jgi:hypothetical protein